MAGIAQLQKGNLTPAVSYTKIFLMIFVIAFFSVLLVVGFLHYQSKQNTVDLQSKVEVASSHLPDGFYPSFTRRDLEEKRNLTDEKAVESVNSLNFVQNPQIQSASSEQNENVTTQVEPPASPTQRLTPEEIMIRDQLALIRQLQEERRVRLLARRGTRPEGWNVVESMPEIAAREKPTPKPPSDKDFSSQGIEKDESTFPVDLSRVVTADRTIPCILIDQINSQLEGRVSCTVERNVFGFHGRNILIPAGTKIMGSHGTLKKVGDERFNITWTRLLRPDGAHVKLTDAYASDAIGGTGVPGHVNRRNWEKYGGAILTSTVSVLAQMSIPSEGTNISNSVFESFSTDLGRVTAAMLNENINIKPYSVVPAGTRILVKPTTDIWLKQEGRQLSFNAVDESF